MDGRPSLMHLFLRALFISNRTADEGGTACQIESHMSREQAQQCELGRQDRHLKCQMSKRHQGASCRGWHKPSNARWLAKERHCRATKGTIAILCWSPEISAQDGVREVDGALHANVIAFPLEDRRRLNFYLEQQVPRLASTAKLPGDRSPHPRYLEHGPVVDACTAPRNISSQALEKRLVLLKDSAIFPSSGCPRGVQTSFEASGTMLQGFCAQTGMQEGGTCQARASMHLKLVFDN